MRRHDFIIAILVVLFFVLLSLPYQFEYNYSSESPFLWVAYFIMGGILAVYVFYIFLQTRRHLVNEDEGKKEEQR
jgi:Ca2+/H+ antiporter